MAEKYYKATICNLACADLHTGINGNGGGAWNKVSFCFVFLRLGQLLATAGTRMAMCCGALAKNNAKSMTVANGGNAIDDRLSVGAVRLLPG